MIPRRGGIYLVRLDKKRPALVISPDYRNEFASDVIVVPASTRLSKLATHVLLKKGEAGLKSDSVLKCEQITTLNKSDFAFGPLGPPLSASRVHEVERAIIRALGVALP